MPYLVPSYLSPSVLAVIDGPILARYVRPEDYPDWEALGWVLLGIDARYDTHLVACSANAPLAFPRKQASGQRTD